MLSKPVYPECLADGVAAVTKNMSAFGGKADIPDRLAMSANDPKRKSPLFLTSGMGRSSIQPWGPRSPHEAQGRSIAFRSCKRRDAPWPRRI